MNSDEQKPQLPGTKFFGKRKPTSGADLRPAEIVPDGMDMNLFTDSILAGQKAIEAENKKNLDARIADEYRIACDVARAEQADAKAKEADRLVKQRLHEGVNQRHQEEQARKKEARQKAVLASLVDFTAAIGKAALLVDELTTRDVREIRLLRAALVELEISLSKP